MISRGSRRAVVAFAAIVAVGGCADDAPAPPRVTSTVTVTPSSASPASSAPSPSPTLPPEAQQPTRPGAEAFARYFFAVYNYATWARDSRLLRSVSDSECVYCNSMIEWIDSLRPSGSMVLGGRIDIPTAVSAPGEPHDRVVVNLLVDQEAGKTLSSSGQVIDSSPEVRKGRIDVAVRWSGDRWLLLDAHIVESSGS